LPSEKNISYDPFDAPEQGGRFDWGERLHHYYFLSKRLVRRFWWILLVAVLAGVAVQGYSELQKEPVYVSQASMIVSGRIALPENVYREELSHFFGTQIDLMMSPRVQNQAHERVEMLNPELERSWVNLHAAQKPQTSIFILRASGGSPSYTRAFLNAVMEEYQNFRRDMRAQTSENTLLAITEQLYRLEEEIDVQEEAVEAFQKRNNLVFLKEQGSAAGSYLAQLKNNQAEMRTRLLILENLSESNPADLAAAGSIDADDVIEIGRTGRNDPLPEAQEQLRRLKAERDEFARYLRPRHPKMLDLESEIERAENLLEILRRQTVQQVGERKTALQRQITNLDSVIEQWEHTALEISRLSAEFERLRSRLDRSRSTYQRLLDSIQSININQQLEQETVEVMEYASAARAAPIEVRRKMAEGGAIGLLAGVAFVALIGFLDTRIITTEDLRNRFEYPVLGTMPEEDRGVGGDVVALKLKDERHLFGEACRTLRSSLFFQKNQKGERPRTFVVTSAIPEEGKSTIALNLAIAFSFTSARTLLLDTDLRRGRINDMLGLPSRPGLSDVLSRETEWNSAIRKTEHASMDFLAHGGHTERPGELLLGPRFPALLEELKAEYDFIICDSAPILAADDTVGFAGGVDSVLLAVRSNFTLARQVKGSLERLANRHIPVSGFILNCADTRGADYYYHYHHKYDQEEPVATP